MPLPALVFVTLGACAAPTTDDATRTDAAVDRPNWVVIMPDSLRADRIGASPSGSIPAPNLTRLAGEGTTFTNAFSQGGWTNPALASFLTGQYPFVLRFDAAPPSGGSGLKAAPDAAGAWATGTRPVAEILGHYGYQTVAFWGDTCPSHFPVFFEGFTTNFVWGPGRGPRGPRVPEWIANDAKEPFFALLHDTDLNASLMPPARLPGPQGALDAYDRSLRAYDQTIARVWASIEARGFADNTILVITSNHGLDFFGHGSQVDHGTLYDAVIRVPFAIRDPRALGRGVVDTTVQAIDLAPTILERSGVRADVLMNGHSLLPLLGSPGTYPPTDVYSMSSATDLALRTDRYKLIQCRSDCCGAARPNCGGPQVFKLFDLEADPGELHDIAAEHPDVVAEYGEKLRTWQRGADPAGAPAMNPDQKKMLQEQGYWSLVSPE